MKIDRLDSRTEPPHQGCHLAAGCALGLLAGAISLLAQTNEAPQIRFLHLKIKDQRVSLVDTLTRPGVLKPQLNQDPGGLQYELVSTAGVSLWKGAVPDPAWRHFEYEDPPGSGLLKRQTVVLNEAEFTIRVPAITASKRLDLYRLQPTGSEAKAEQSAVRKLLGSVSWP